MLPLVINRQRALDGLPPGGYPARALEQAVGGPDMDDLRLSDISHDGRFLTLSDGTRWLVADLDVERSARWEPRERVAVSDRTGDASRIVNNLDRWDEPVRAWAWGGQEQGRF